MNTEYTFFWTGVFSQWYPAQFVIDGVQYNCAEQYMMAHKALLFDDLISYKKIMSTQFPHEQKNIGRNVTGFCVKDWITVARQRVYEGNYAKFTQNLKMQDKLVSTYGTVLVEASPFDKIWGIGLSINDALSTPVDQWKGTNWLGEVLTNVRDDIIVAINTSSNI